MALLTIAGLAIPLGMEASTNRTQKLWFGRYVDAERFADLAAEAVATGNDRSLIREAGRYHRLRGDHILVVGPTGQEVVNTGVRSEDSAVREALLDALRNRHPRQPPHRLRPWDPDIMVVARPVGMGVRVKGAVLIETSTVLAKQDIVDRFAVISLVGWTALALFTGLAVLLSRWILSPLSKLSSSLADLTVTLPKPVAGARTAPIRRDYGGPPEIRELAASFDAMVQVVTGSIEAQRRLVADTAHAIRNPLAALSIRLESLGRFVPEKNAAIYQRAIYQVDRLSAVLDGLLRLAVAETPADVAASTSDPDWPQECEARRVVDDRVDEWQPVFEGADMELVVAMPTGDVPMAVPADVLDQILDVILSNAARYAGAGARTEVRLEAEGDRVIITVTDNGVGVAADELDRLTNRFFRGATAEAGGTGLGLSIAAALAQRHRGELRVEAVTPHGLRVVVHLPRRHADMVRDAGPAAPSTTGRLSADRSRRSEGSPRTGTS